MGEGGGGVPAKKSTPTMTEMVLGLLGVFFWGGGKDIILSGVSSERDAIFVRGWVCERVMSVRTPYLSGVSLVCERVMSVRTPYLSGGSL